MALPSINIYIMDHLTVGYLFQGTNTMMFFPFTSEISSWDAYNYNQVWTFHFLRFIVEL